MILTLIAGVARNGVIGRDNQLLWHLPEDLRHFRAATMGAPVIMGRKTWESLPARFRPLPGRRNLVLSRQAGFEAPGAEVLPDLEAALEVVRSTGAPRAFVIGGEQVYRAALPLADELQLTEVERDFEGDAHFPAFARGDFAEVARERHQAAPPNDFAFSFVTYRRRAPRN
jgi:dihydrofolate reductase